MNACCWYLVQFRPEPLEEAMLSRALALLLLGGVMACGASRSEDEVETSEEVAESRRVATDTLVTRRTVVDTTIVTIDTSVAVDTTLVVDTTYAVDTTMVEGGRGEIVDTAQAETVDTTD
jgi:hypothetical protein